MLYDHATGARLQHNADGTFSFRADQAEGRRAAAAVIPNTHIIKGELRVGPAGSAGQPGAACEALGLVLNDWQLSGIWTASTGDRL